MAPEFKYEPRTINDKSQLTPNWHPAYLLEIGVEEVPDGWEMKKKNSHMYRWKFCVWEGPHAVTSVAPEFQSVVSSPQFSPPGKYQASKAFVFTQKLLGRKIEPGEHVNLDPAMPLACQVLINRTDKNGAPSEYANIMDVGAWPDGAALLTPELRQKLAAFLAMKTGPANGQAQAPAPTPQPTYAQPAPTYAPPAPAMATAAPAPMPTPHPQPQQPTLPGTPPPLNW